MWLKLAHNVKISLALQCSLLAVCCDMHINDGRPHDERVELFPGGDDSDEMAKIKISLIHEIGQACRAGDLENVIRLVYHMGVSVNQIDEWSCTPLYYACLCGHIEVAKFLLEAGAFLIRISCLPCRIANSNRY